MKTIIAGSRDITDIREVEKAIKSSGFSISEVVCGGARGVDALGWKWAGGREGVRIILIVAQWDKFGKSAGYKRNEEMAEYADALIAVWDGKSKGTKHMIDIATRYGLPVFVHKI